MFKMVLEARLPTAHDQDQKISEDLPERALKLRALDVNKGKSHINCYNFI